MPAAVPRAGIVSSIGMKLVTIPKGTFTMGSPIDEEDRRDDEQQREVEITRDFHLGEKAVTQEQYEQVMGKNPSYFSARGGGKAAVSGMTTSQFPVECVTWH